MRVRFYLTFVLPQWLTLYFFQTLAGSLLRNAEPELFFKSKQHIHYFKGIKACRSTSYRELKPEGTKRRARHSMALFFSILIKLGFFYFNFERRHCKMPKESTVRLQNGLERPALVQTEYFPFSKMLFCYLNPFFYANVIIVLLRKSVIISALPSPKTYYIFFFRIKAWPHLYCF